MLVELAGHWFLREHEWRLHDDGRLYAVGDRTRIRLIEEENDATRAARARLTAVAEELFASGR